MDTKFYLYIGMSYHEWEWTWQSLSDITYGTFYYAWSIDQSIDDVTLWKNISIVDRIDWYAKSRQHSREILRKKPGDSPYRGERREPKGENRMANLQTIINFAL